jgi:hypothetical protein
MMTESLTFTKDYAVGFKRADCNIPKQSWNFFGRQPGHSNSMLSFLCGLMKRRFFDNHIKGPWKHLPES